MERHVPSDDSTGERDVPTKVARSASATSVAFFSPGPSYANAPTGDGPSRTADFSVMPIPIPFAEFEFLSGCTDLDTAHFKNVGLPQEIMRQMDAFREDNELCDVELLVGDEVISAHRYVLAAAIPYFRAMFTNQMAERKMSRIAINDISKEALKLLVDFVYTNEISISGANVQQLLFAASVLQMDDIVSACQQFLTKTITSHNCLVLRQFAELYNCTHLLDATDTFAVNNFSELRRRDDFRTIPYSHVRALLQRSDLNVNDEQEVFEALIEWIEYDKENRLVHLSDLFEMVRLPLLNMRYLCDVVKQHPLIKQSGECRDFVAEALFEMLSPLKDSMMPIAAAIHDSGTGQYAVGLPVSWAPSANFEVHDGWSLQSSSSTTSLRDGQQLTPNIMRKRPRKSVAGVVFCAGGRGTAGDPFRSVEAYDWRRDLWFSIPEMTTQRRHVGVVSARGKLYAIGGHDGVAHLPTAEVFVPEKGKWDKISSMQTARRGIAVATLDAAIYAVGGLDDSTCFKTVERYDIELNSWSQVAEMTIQRGGVGVAALGKYLYAIGGNDGTSSLDSCEKFDPLLDRWRLVAKMTNRRAGAGVCVLDGHLYAIGGFDDNAPLATCERYDPQADVWTPLTNMRSARGGVGVAAMGGHVYAIGGHDGTRYLNTVECFDPSTNTWEPIAGIRECRAGAGVAWADCRVDQLLRSNAVQDSGCAPSAAGSQCV